eukprot:10644303-Lingulodinium_polyedra.AAC.1
MERVCLYAVCWGSRRGRRPRPSPRGVQPRRVDFGQPAFAGADLSCSLRGLRWHARFRARRLRPSVQVVRTEVFRRRGRRPVLGLASSTVPAP